jgi:hypothetical protein
MPDIKEERKDRYIKIPSTVVLTKEGMDIVSMSQVKIVKVKNHLGFVREGIDADSINAQILQKMVMNSYVEEVFCHLPEFLSFRSEIMSINSLIIYAILYKKLGPTISDMFFHSAVVKDFNRKNPKHAIVNLQQINKKIMDEIMVKQKDFYDSLKKSVAEEVVARIDLNGSLLQEDKDLQKKSLDKFINWIDNRMWYIYNIICKTNLADEMKSDLANIIAVYLNRTQIATHLSNLLMELSQNAEKAHLERICIRNNLTKPGEVDRFLRAKENRDAVAAIAKKNNELLTVSWNMSPERNTIGQQYRVKISITNYGLIDEFTRMQISKKLKTDVEGVSIADFYKKADFGGGRELGAGLGLLYNSYLEDYCQQQGIVYRCNIVPETKYEKTTVIIDISL